MLWAALLPPPPRDPAITTSARSEALSGLATWCLQWTPRVALLEPLSDAPAVVMELQASERLFGGKRRLVERVRQEVQELGVQQLSWAPTSHAALALARCGQSNGFLRPLEQLLDALPIDCLSFVAVHRATLLRLGCQTLGQVRSLPRGGLSRRFDAQLLAGLDQAYGLRPEAHVWVQLPQEFKQRMELMARVELAPALVFAARRLLVQMAAWLLARRAGVTAFTLRWWYDAMRSREAGTHGELTIRTAQATRDVDHLARLLAEHLAKVELQAPVGDLELVAVDVQLLHERSQSLLPDSREMGEGAVLAYERIAARLGAQRVKRPVLHEDHRREWMCRWQVGQGGQGRQGTGPRVASRSVDIPQPTYILPEPLRLAMRGPRPLYQGTLQLLAGPHRVEGAWWDRTLCDAQQVTRHVARDYWLAWSEHAKLLWIFQTRLATSQESAWFLQGYFY